MTFWLDLIHLSPTLNREGVKNKLLYGSAPDSFSRWEIVWPRETTHAHPDSTAIKIGNFIESVVLTIILLCLNKN